MNRRTFLSISARLGGLMLIQMAGVGCRSQRPDTLVTLNPLPYKADALAPYLSETTVNTHYEKHHAGYVVRAKQLLAGSRYRGKTLTKVIAAARKAGDTALFNNTAQALNHDLYWQSMAPGGGGKPEGSLRERMQDELGGYSRFRETVVNAAAERFGSGWVWLVDTADGLSVMQTANAETPAAGGDVVLIALDVWEHAYYLDYRHRRQDYVEAFLDHLVNWDFAERQLKARR